MHSAPASLLCALLLPPPPSVQVDTEHALLPYYVPCCVLPPPATQCEVQRPTSLLCATPLSCVQVNVNRGLSYLRCTSNQISTTGMPCEAGVIASDKVDGASIQDRVKGDSEGAAPSSMISRPAPFSPAPWTLDPKTCIMSYTSARWRLIRPPVRHPRLQAGCLLSIPSNRSAPPFPFFHPCQVPSLSLVHVLRALDQSPWFSSPSAPSCMQILMCPPDTCLTTGGGCTGSRVTDKQPVACGVDTVNADVGTTYTLIYAVYNSAGVKATVQRVITVVSPCGSGQYLCGSNCSAVSMHRPQCTSGSVRRTVRVVSSRRPAPGLRPALRLQLLTWFS